jgi:GNAT superfamily N-acetyltransferase
MPVAPVTIRKAHADDVDAIARVHVEMSHATYADIFPPEHLATITFERRQTAWRSIVADRDLITLVAEHDGDVVGFASGGARREGPASYTGELQAVYLLPAHHRQGLGRRLVTKMIQALIARGHQSMLVWVLKDNPACRFYERLGGVAIATTTLTRAGRNLEEVAYGWADLSHRVI